MFSMLTYNRVGGTGNNYIIKSSYLSVTDNY